MVNIFNIVKKEFYTKTYGVRQVEDFYIFKNRDEYGVGLKNINNVNINESFSNVQIKTVEGIINNENISLILLTTSLETHKNEFASFCMQFLDKGNNNSNRELILNDPYTWWEKWRELIGNKLYNAKPYDVIAELLTIERLAKEGYKEIEWKGPTGSSIDIQTQSESFEVKSSLIRYENEITISSQFQLDIEQEKNSHTLFFYKMEELENAESIDKIMGRLSKLNNINIEDIEKKVNSIGYKKFSSARKKSYVIHEVRKYKLDDTFPRITKNSFKDNKIPNNIKKINYVVNLDNIEYEIIE